MNFAKLTYPQAPVIQSEPLAGGRIKVKGSYQVYSLERPIGGAPFFILKIENHGQYVISALSIIDDVVKKIEDEDPK